MKQVYRQARSRADRAAMDKEYQQMRAAGKTVFKSSVTGLDYAIPENKQQAGKKQAQTGGTSNTD